MASAIVTKRIRSAKFRQEVFFEEFEKEARVTRDEMKHDFELTTIGWKTPVEFEDIVEIGPTAISVLVGTDNEIYGYVNDGTRPHKIRAKNAKTLAFQTGYNPMTKPGKLVHNPAGGQSSGPWVFPVEVQHPGTEARNFDKLIHDTYEPIFKRRMENAMRRAARRSGHGR